MTSTVDEFGARGFAASRPDNQAIFLRARRHSRLVRMLRVAVPGTFFFGGAFSAWVGQGGSLYALLGLGALAGVIEAEPAPIGTALRDDIEALATGLQEVLV